MSILDFGYRLALGPIRALCAFCGSSVRSTVFRYQVCMLIKISIKVRPSTFTTFNQVIAVHDLLWRDILRLDSVFQIQPSIDSLSESNSVAGPTRTLVSVLIQKVVALYISVIVIYRKFRVW